MSPPSNEILAEKIKQLIPLLKGAEQAGTDIQLLKQRLDALDDGKVSDTELAAFELRLSLDIAANILQSERDMGEMRKKLFIISMLEKVAVGIIIYYTVKGGI
jgi:hypothetical protein